MEMGQLLERSKIQLGDMTGLKPVSATGAFKDEKGWHIAVEMLEMSRIPPSSDLLGEYETLLNDDGEMLRFARKRTRLRGEQREDGASPG